MVIRVVGAFMLTASIAAVAASGGSPESKAEAPAAPAAAPAADHAQHPAGTARVFFMEPANGATVKSPIQFVFGSEMVTISPVPKDAKEARPGMAHFHLGVDTDCLPAGQPIPKAQPWIHFGDGKNTIEMAMTPGPHKFAVQAGDDLHTAGLCETITVTVAAE
jgi:hypothetical protein